MRIVAFDPGEETGVAIGTVDGDTLTIEHHGWDRWLNAAFKFRNGATQRPFDVCVFESWKLTKRGAKTLVGSDMPWSQFIGIMKLVCYDNKIQVVEQQPADKYVVNAVVTGNQEYDSSWLPESPVDHNKDALRHLIWYAVRVQGVKNVQFAKRTLELHASLSSRTDEGVPGV